MKKFLLLLVGVLFALSAKAYDWVLYVDIQNTGWITAENPNPTVYFYCGEGSSDVKYYGQQTGTRVYGTLYKFSFSWNDNALTHGIFSTKNIAYNDYYGKALNSYANGTDTYGELDSGSDDNTWKLVPNRLYVLATTGTNKIASVTDNYSPAPSKDIYIVGSDPLTWGNRDYPATTYKLTRTGEYTYEYNFKGKTFSQGTSTSEFLIIEGTTWSDKHGTNDTNNKLVANSAYHLQKSKNSGNNVKVGEEIVNPTVVVDVQNWTVTFKTPTDHTIYFDAVRSGWESVTVSGVDATIADDGTKALKKVTYSAVEGTKVTFSNGTKSYNVTPTNGNVYYVESSSLKDGYAYADYSWASPTPTTYYYRLHGSIFTNGVKEDGGWYTQKLMTKNADGTYSFTATIKSGGFGIKRLESESTEDIAGTNTWINSPSEVSSMVADFEYDAQVKNNNGYDFKTELSGEYTIIFNPTTMKVKLVAGAVTPTTYRYRFHSNMVSGTWPADDNNDPAWAMTKQSDGTWMWEGTLTASGAFGFKRLGEDEAPSKNNQWIYCSSKSANAITRGEWSGAKLKANNTDTSGADWTFTPDGGTYQVIFDPANMRTKIVKVGTTVDYSGRTYVISGTFNGWIAPADNTANCLFVYQTEGENRGKYVWSYTGLMKNVEFKICDLSNLAEDSDKKWGKAYGTTYTGSNRDKLTAGTPSTPGTPYNMRRTNVPGEDVLIETAELYNPTFVLDPATMTLTVINNPVTAQYKYGIHSNFADQNNWSCAEMTEHADGSWSYTVAIPNGRRFGIRQAEKGKDITVKDNQTAWVSSSETTNTKVDGNDCVTALVATNHGTKKDGLNWATDNAAFNGTTSYTIVFTPAKNTDGSVKTDGTGTLVIYNNTAVDATIQPAMAENGTDYLIVDGQKANEIVVKVPVANYLGTTEGTFTLAMGDNAIASASKDAEGNVTFEYLPYLSGTREFTLKGADKAVKLNVNSPELAGSYFTLGKYKSLTLVANANGYIDVAVACEPTSTLVYDIPVWYYTIGDYTYEAEEVYWSTNGFSFNVKNLAEYDPSTYKAKEEGIATCYGTPIFPFVVRKTAATLAEDASNLTIQQFGGSKASFQVKIQVDEAVSGVEGVVIEAEDAPVEYYNLQGQRVNGDLAPGIYIRRQGTTVTKVRI